MSTTGMDEQQPQKQNQLRKGTDPESDYSAFLAHVKATFKAAIADPDVRLFYVEVGVKSKDADADDELSLPLFDQYLAHIHPSQRQVHTCNKCRSFMKKFGGLVYISKKGKIKSALWNEEGYEGPYEDVIATLRMEVESQQIKGVFYSKESELGEETTGGTYFNEPVWHHLSVKLPKRMLHSNPLLSARQQMAAKREGYKHIVRAVSDFPIDLVNKSIALLESGQLFRADAVLPSAKFLQETLLERAGATGNLSRSNLLWKRVASSPDPFLSPSSHMIGTLLKDMQKGLSIKEIKATFADKMAPDKHLRAQKAPKAGNIRQAEDVISKLNAAGALERRFARLDEIVAQWTPLDLRAKNVESAPGAVFSHLKPRGATLPSGTLIPTKGMGPTVVTWSVFQEKVLPQAVRIQANIPVHASFGAFTTAEYEEAEPIMVWDKPEQRNPFAWYVYMKGSSAQQWGLVPGQWLDVLAVSKQPHAWFDEKAYSQFGEGVLLILPNCKDQQYKTAGVGLFPHCLRPELHGVRATIEAFSNTAVLSGFDAPNLACGIKLSKGANLVGYVLRVQRKDGTVLSYALDRWE